MPAINTALTNYECENTKKLNLTFRKFAKACRSNDEPIIWETFEVTRQNHFWFLMRGLELAGMHNQVNSLKTLACLLRDEDFIERPVAAYGGENVIGFLFDWWDRDLVTPEYAVLKQFMYEFIPSLANTKYFHETPWFRLMVAYILSKKKLEFAIFDF
jgi:hypothetical protein